MSTVKMKVSDIVMNGLWTKVCDSKDWDYYLVAEGRIDEEEWVEFDIKVLNGAWF